MAEQDPNTDEITIENGFLNSDVSGGLPSDYGSDETLGQLAATCRSNALAALWKEHDVDGPEMKDVHVVEMRVYESGGKEVVEYIAKYRPGSPGNTGEL